MSLQTPSLDPVSNELEHPEPAVVLERRVVGQELRFALAETAAGGSKVVMLVGESGSGKTQQAHDLLPLVHQRGGMLIESRIESLNWSNSIDSLLLGLGQLSLPLSKQLSDPGLSGQAAFFELALRLGLTGHTQGELDLSQPLQVQLLVGEMLSYASESLKPLVWIIDDVDLLDQDAIAVIDYLIQNRPIPYLMVLLCVRSEQHAAVLRWSTQPHCQRLHLAPFSVRDTVAWLIEEQNLNPRLAAEIAPYLQQTCQGNLQLCRFLLDSLAAHELLTPVAEDQWAARLQQIALQLRTPEAESFFSAQLRALPETCLEVLQSASLIGMEFDARLLHDYLPLSAVQEHLVLAQQQGLIEALSGDIWRFVHPHLLRLAQHTFEFHTEAELHARLALRMMKYPSFALQALRHAQQAGAVFSLAERVKMAEQSLEIAAQVFQQGSPLHAGQILEQLLALIGESIWRDFPALSEDIVAAWCATWQDASQLAELQALQRCVPEHASQRVWYLLAATHLRLALVAHDYRRAFAAAEVALDSLDVPMSMLGDRWQIAYLLLEQLATRLFHRPSAQQSKSERINTAQEIMADLLVPSFFARPSLLLALTLKQLTLTRRHGLTPSSAVAHLCAAMVWRALGQPLRASAAAVQARQLAAELSSDRQRPRVAILDLALVQPWHNNLQQLLPDLWRWQQHANTSGDFEFAALGYLFYLGHSILNGSPLLHLEKEAAKVDEDLRHTRQLHLLPLSAIYRQFLHAATRGASDTEPWSGVGVFVSQTTLDQLIDRDEAVHLFHHYLGNAYLASLCYAPVPAGALIAQARQYLPALKGTINAALLDYLAALSACTAPEKMSYWTRHTVRRTLQCCQKWAAENPSLFASKAALLQAEWANCAQQWDVAQHYYLAAIDAAREHQQHHEYGAAALYYARFLLARQQFHHARQMLQLAIEQYEAWGAMGLASYVRREFAPFLAKARGI